jgi:hypothetical protein
MLRLHRHCEEPAIRPPFQPSCTKAPLKLKSKWISGRQVEIQDLDQEQHITARYSGRIRNTHTNQRRARCKHSTTSFPFLTGYEVASGSVKDIERSWCGGSDSVFLNNLLTYEASSKTCVNNSDTAEPFSSYFSEASRGGAIWTPSILLFRKLVISKSTLGAQ